MMKQLRLTDLTLTDNQTERARKWLEKMKGQNFISLIDEKGHTEQYGFDKLVPDIDIEAVMTLGGFFFSYVQMHLDSWNNWMEALLSDTLLRYSGESESDCWSTTLCGLETFLKCLGKLVFREKSAEIGKALLFQLTSPDNPDFRHLPAHNGRTSIIDFDISQVPLLASTLRNYRNINIHRPEFAEDARHAPTANPDRYLDADDCAPRLLKQAAALMVLTINYHFDSLYDIVVPEEVKQGTHKPDAMQLLNEVYIAELWKHQSSIVSDIYSFAAGETADDSRQNIIEVKVIPTELDDQDDIKEQAYPANEMADSVSPATLIGDGARRLLLFVGDAGTGKSIMVTSLVKQCVRRWQLADQAEERLLPVRIDLRQLNSQQTSLKSAMRWAVTREYANNKEKQDCVEELVTQIFKDGRAVVFLDGLDEMRDSSRLLEELPLTLRDYPCQYIITSRLQGMEQSLADLSHFETYAMCPLNDELISEQLRYTSEVSQRMSTKSLQSIIKSSDVLYHMAANPFMLMLIVKMLVTSGSDTGELKLYGGRGGLLFEFVRRMSWREGKKKANYSQEDLERVLAFVSHTLMSSNNCDVEWTELKYAFEQQTEIFGGRSQQLRECIDQAASIGIVATDDSNTIVFSHKSWQDYFFALKYVIGMERIATSSSSIDDVVALIKKSYTDNDHAISTSLLLKTILEVMEQKRSLKLKDGKEAIDNLTCSLIMRLLKAFHSDAPPTMTILPASDNLCRIEGRLAMPNEALKMLATAVSTLRKDATVNKDPKDDRRFFRPQPRKLVEMLLINLLIIYRRAYPEGYIDKKILPQLFITVARSGCERPTDELFTPYWLKMWLLNYNEVSNIMGRPYADVIITDDELLSASMHQARGWKKVSKPNYQQGKREERFIDVKELLREKEARNKLRLMSLIIVTQHNNPLYILKKLVEIYDKLFSRRLKYSARQTASLIARLMRTLDNRSLHSVYDSMMQSEKTFAARMAANEALLLMDDTDFMIRHYDKDIKYSVHKFCIDNLLRKATEKGIPEFLLLLCRLGHVSKNDVLTFMITGNIAPDKVKVALDDPEAQMLTPRNRIANILPPEEVPDWYVEKYYDKDVFRYILDSRQADKTEATELAIHQVKYSFDSSSHNIIFPKPEENVDGLFFRLNRETTITAVGSCSERDGHTLCLQLPADRFVDNEGSIYFYSDAEGQKMVKMHFKSLISVVHFSDSTRYHSALCPLLIAECLADHSLGSPSLFEFFSNLGNAASYLEYYDKLDYAERKKHGWISPKICVVAERKSAAITLYSPQIAGITPMFQRSVQERSSLYEKGLMEIHYPSNHTPAKQLFVCERNNLLRPACLNQRLPEYGFVNGIVLNSEANKDYHIHSDLIIPDFYYANEGTPLRKGDVVSFFPSVNMSTHHRNRPIATNVEFIESGVQTGIVKTIEKRADEYTISIISEKRPTADIKSFIRLTDDNLSLLDQLTVGQEVCFFLNMPRIKDKNRAYIIFDNHD